MKHNKQPKTKQDAKFDGFIKNYAIANSEVFFSQISFFKLKKVRFQLDSILCVLLILTQSIYGKFKKNSKYFELFFRATRLLHVVLCNKCFHECPEMLSYSRLFCITVS